MDYEKKYKEALVNMQELYNSMKYMSSTDALYTTTALERAFPELKESEDEKMLREIKRYIKEQGDKPTGLPNGNVAVSDMLAWLEKQGEQKSEKVSIWKHWKDGIAGNGAGKQMFLIKNHNTYSLSSCLAFECDYIELSELDKLMEKNE